MSTFRSRWAAAALAVALLAAGPVRSYARQAAAREQVLRPGHGGRVTGLAFSPDGALLASCSFGEGGFKPGAVKLWRVKTGELVRTLEAGKGQVESVAFSPDGRLLAVGGGVLYHGDVTVFDPSTGKVRWARRDVATTNVVRVAFSPDGKTLASTGDAGSRKGPVVRLWDAATGEPRRRLEGHKGGVKPVAFAPDGKTLATGGTDGAVLVWDARTGALERKLLADAGKGPQAAVEALAFTPGGKTLAAAGPGGKVRLWDGEAGKVVREIAVEGGRPLALAVSPDGKRLASGIRGRPRVRVWGLPGGAEVTTWDGGEGDGAVVAISPDGGLLAVGHADGAVRLLSFVE